MPRKVAIRPITAFDAEAWQNLRCNLWPDQAQDHGSEIAGFFAGHLAEPLAVLLAMDGANTLAISHQLRLKGTITYEL
jgi:hypothetical protein